MALVLTEEQRLLRDSAHDFLADNAPVESLRKLRDERNALGYDPEVWQNMAELGWASIILPEQYGGLDFGFTGLGLIMEETGRTLLASPIFACSRINAYSSCNLEIDLIDQRF
ncbi:MAG: acyl-CoA dehydrogenase family protein [Halieaceae bacterium]|nr:acyl-CoA dehydrogenase family protein [Halieaceae bacterium]